MPSSMSECAYPKDYDSMTIGEQLLMADWAGNTIFAFGPCTPFFKWQYAVNLLCVVVWLIIGRCAIMTRCALDNGCCLEDMMPRPSHDRPPPLPPVSPCPCPCPPASLVCLQVDV